MHNTTLLGETPLTLENVRAVAFGAQVQLSKQAVARINAARALVERKATSEVPTYGINTGFGALAEVKIAPDQVAALQRNLILSHAAGVGRPLARAETRAMMLLRAQTLIAGHSGAR